MRHARAIAKPLVSPCLSTRAIWTFLGDLISRKIAARSPLAGLVLDIVKAFNILDRGLLRAIMLRLGFDDVIVNAWLAMLGHMSRTVLVDGSVYGGAHSSVGVAVPWATCLTKVFKKAFESMIETQLQEQRLTQFRQKLAARRRKGQDSSDGGDQEWQSYLKRPVPATELSIRSIREAGCMLRFLVCQTSISIGAGEVLGQIAFQEHFPIDGVAQEPSKSTKPMPRWVYGLGACTAFMTVVTITAWYQVVRQIAFSGAEAALG
eukprot:s1617_g6.t1